MSELALSAVETFTDLLTTVAFRQAGDSLELIMRREGDEVTEYQEERIMRCWHILACLTLIATMLTACGAAQAIESEVTQLSETDSGYESDALNSGAGDGLDAAAQLALGTLMLEETDHTVTFDQAKTLLPLWQALQGGVTAEDEIKAVLRGIEGAMTEEQLATIADMELTQEDMRSLIEERGMGRPDGFVGGEEAPSARATRQAEGGGAVAPGGERLSGEDTPPEMATRVAEFQNMSEEERKAMMATVQAGGGPGAGFRGGLDGATGTVPGVMGQLRFLLRPVITMLETRAGEA